MIKEGAHTFIAGRGPVTPFLGKYAPKCDDVFDRIEHRFAAAGLAGMRYRPLRIELELTTKCNDSCPSCGMGALPLAQGITVTPDQRARIVDEFDSIGLPTAAVTGGEPFVAAHALYPLIKALRQRGIDISKLTSNGLWGASERRMTRTFEQLKKADFFGNQLVVPLIMLSIGEQTMPLEWVARILHHAVTHYSDRELNVAVSSLADPADRQHKIYELIATYERRYGDFPHDRVHSTMRVYLDNERLPEQKKQDRPGHTSVRRWMDACFDCFAPTVGTYILPSALLKQDGRWYSCASFDVPDSLGFGNIFTDSLRTILERANSSEYLQLIATGGGLKGLHGAVPAEFTENTTCGGFCDSCGLLSGEFRKAKGLPPATPLPIFKPEDLLRRPTLAVAE
ncbi:4Fe-4S cluster-binding domain-containing protein [Kitasatospora acidiphila]|uniref:4Fe-4S cluster-binding domain-containing protein n=1 Tax=Kitasatospora acidiphila TaxID=2567942 RepID=A0A540W8Q1_9ACTN|nr:4Fe-4S cluster-binding domain-containing protein [Kitasatospora acidiphila]TQF04744.1 4Fe-4S cluster-binding domain-containing protein [Kitasatospora acidiphila]